jgi:hypothetical protein
MAGTSEAQMKSLTWIVLLLTTSLPFLLAGTEWSQGIGSSYLSIAGVTLLAIAGIASFLKFSSIQRVPLTVFFVTLIMIAAIWHIIPPVRLTAFIAVVIFAAIVVEAVRQNIPLYRDLITQKVAVRAKIKRSAVLWSPMLLLILIGAAITYWSKVWVEDLVYDTLPIDRYCTFRDVPDSGEFPCTGLGDNLDANEMNEVPSQELLDHYLHDRMTMGRVKAAKIQSAEHIVSVDDASEAYQKALNYVVPLVALDPEPSTAFRRPWELAMSLVERMANSDPVYQELLEKGQKAGDIRPFVPALDARMKELLGPAREELDKNSDLQALEVRAMLFKYLRALRVTDFPPQFPGPSIPREQKKSVESAQLWARRDLQERSDAIEEVSTSGAQLFFGFKEVSPLPMTGGFMDYYTWEGVNAKEEVAKVVNDRSRFSAVLGFNPQCTTRRSSGKISGENYRLYEEGKKPYAELPREEMNLEWFDCPPSPAHGRFIEPVGLDRSIELSLAYMAKSKLLELDSEFQRTMKATRLTGDAAREASAKSLGLVSDRIDLGREKCRGGFMPVSHCLANAAKERAEGGYQSAVSKSKRRITAEVDKATGEGEELARNQISIARDQTYRTSAEGQRVLKEKMDEIRTLRTLLSIVAWLGLALAVFKSFLYVLATEIFNKNELSRIKLDQLPPGPYGTFETTDRLIVGHDFTLPLITRRKYVGTNQEVRTLFFWRFQPTVAIVSRLLNGAYLTLNKGSHASSEKPIYFKGSKEKRIVRWSMVDGEQVIFSYPHFHGISSNVRLGTFVSLHLSTLLLGRYIFHTATCVEGNGMLLLRTVGDCEPNETKFESLERLVAWNRGTQFHVLSHRDHQSIFVDGYQIGPTDDAEGKPTGLVLGKVHESGLGFQGIARFARTFLMPF